MTGIERLRSYARRMDELHVWPGGAKLLDIAGQIEREQGQRVSRMEIMAIMSDMKRHVFVNPRTEDVVAQWASRLSDALGGRADAEVAEDAEAIAWVRDHGGLSEVRDEWNRRSNLKRQLSKAKGSVERQQRHIEHVQGVCKMRQARICELNKLVAEMRPRLLPPDKEWPRYTDGTPINFDDEVVGPDYGERFSVKSVQFHPNGFTMHGDFDWSQWYEDDDRFEYPAPKVLDADGAEIRVGDTVWHVETGEQCKVAEVDSRSVSVDFRVGGDGIKHTGSILPANLTHRAPVLAADGRPLREGETVWRHGSAESLLVDRVESECGDAPNVRFSDGSWDRSGSLTHERPDSWERLEEDAEKGVCKYFDQSYGCGSCPHYPSECQTDKTRDIVRRARALAGGA